MCYRLLQRLLQLLLLLLLLRLLLLLLRYFRGGDEWVLLRCLHALLLRLL